MGRSLMENFVPKVAALAASEDMYNGSPATDIFNLKHYGEITFLVCEVTGGTGAATITVEECDDVTPTTSTAIAFDYAIVTSATTTGMFGGWTRATSSGITTGANGTQYMAVKVHDSELSAGFPYIRLQTTESESPAVDGFIITFLGKSDYMGDNMIDPSV